MPFNENWYDKTQLKNLVQLYNKVRPLKGLVIEIGCWEGRSACKLANAAYPDVLHAVDTWEGNIAEGEDHPSVQIARKRDVFSVFKENVAIGTKGNVEAHRQDCFEYLKNLSAPVKFCHIDAAHDYESVKRTIELLLPYMVSGGILCGDDYVSANAKRDDLQGGVERACQETLKGHYNMRNLWAWSNGPTVKIPFWQKAKDFFATP